MNLNDYPSDELRTLQLALAIARQWAKSTDPSFSFDQLTTWSERVKDAIKDATFEESLTEKVSARQYPLFRVTTVEEVRIS